MSKRRSDAKQRLSARTARVACRLRFEPLEARRLLAGLQVSVFVDLDGSRSFEPASETAAADRLVYIDLNRSGSHDSDEPLQITDADGNALFEGLEAGDYTVGLLSNPDSQLQTTSTRVAQNAALESTTSTSRLLALPDLTNPWSIDSRGVATRVAEAAGSSVDSVDLGGAVLDALQKEEIVWLVIDHDGGAPNSVVEFNLVSGQASELAGQSSGRNVKQFVANQSASLVLFESEGDSWLAPVDFSAGVLKVAEPVSFNADLVAGSPASASIVSSKLVASGLTEVRLHHSLEAEAYPTTALLDGEIDSLSLAADGSKVFAATSGGGVRVLNITTDGQLALEAILAEAAAPVVASTPDNRIITGSTRHRGSVIVWNADTWQPVGTSRIDDSVVGGPVVGGPAVGGSAAVNTILPDIFGDRAWLANADGVYSVDLAVPEAARFTIEDNDQGASVQIGVRMTGVNHLPDVSDFAAREIAEDSHDLLGLDGQAGIVDPDGDALWFSLIAPPTHGSLELLTTGEWSYVPRVNFFGADSATLLVHDGIASTELVLRWQVTPVNDPPLALNWQIPSAAENPTVDTVLGYLSVVDPDPGAEYRITTSDPRFVVSGGQLLFSQGELDFESEPNVVFEITATDLEGEYEISTQVSLVVTDVNEAPTDILLTNQRFLENEAGVAIAEVFAIDQDTSDSYEFLVSDARFEIRDGVLQLAPGQSLDHESESNVELIITAREIGDTGQEISKTVSLTVENVDEPPTDLVFAGGTIQAGSRGATIGQVRVLDPDSDPYAFEVSDARFKVVDGILQLKDDVEIEYHGDSSITLEVVATSPNGNTISRRIPIPISPPTPRHQNPRNPRDVNGDGEVTPLDALILINELNQGRGGQLPITGPGSGESNPHMPDVSGDGSLSPIDVLLIINALNSRGTTAGGEGEGDVSASMSATDPVGVFDDIERRKHHNSQIDAELETLLEQLSQQRLDDA